MGLSITTNISHQSPTRSLPFAVMAFHSMFWRCVLLLAFAYQLNAEFTLSAIPTSGCVGKPSGTATFTSSTSLPNDGAVRMDDGGLWNQIGATWQWILDTPGYSWAYAGIANQDSPGENYPTGISKAFVISPDKSTVSFSIASALGSGYQIKLIPTQEAGAPASIGNTALAAAPTAIDVGASILRRGPSYPEITPSPGSVPNGPKYRVRRQENAPSFGFKLSAETPCAGPPSSSTSVSADPGLASSCSANVITAGTAAFSTYAVSSYMSSLLSAKAPNPTARINPVEILHSDVNPPGAACTYNAQCQVPSCAQVKDVDASDMVVIQRFLAYQQVANFNNYLYQLYEAVYKASEIVGLLSASIVSTFYTNPAPPATWQQIVGALAPFLGLMSACLGPLAAGFSTSMGIANAMIGTGSGVASIAALSAAAEPLFTEFGTIDTFIANYTQASVTAISNAWAGTIGSDSDIYAWTGSNLAPTDSRTGLFGDGSFSSPMDSQGLTANVQSNMAKIIAYKTINYALVDSGNFIQYVPYNTPIHDKNGYLLPNGIDKAWCESNVNDGNKGSLLICDAPGGMAKIFNAGSARDASEMNGAEPQGWKSNLQIVPGENFNVAAVIRGSVASWQAGDFAYDVSAPFESPFQHWATNFTPDQVKLISKLPIAQDAPGYFNIPVMRVLDLESFPPISGMGCMNSAWAASAVGGTKGSTKKFTDNINKLIKDILRTGPNDVSCIQGICARTTCLFTAFAG